MRFAERCSWGFHYGWCSAYHLCVGTGPSRFRLRSELAKISKRFNLWYKKLHDQQLYTMIKKIVYIKNIGRFHDAHMGDQGKCGKITLVSAQNGSGKTTIAAILHSLASGEPGFITERDSLSTTGTPKAKLLLDDECYDFEDGKWKQDVSSVKVEVFDTHFVNTNVYAGDHFEHEHKKELYQFIIGETAGSLDKRIRGINDRSRVLSQKINTCKKGINEHINGQVTFDSFTSLPEINSVNRKIEEKKERVQQLKRIDTLQKRRRFGKLESFSIPVLAIKELLERTLDDVSEAAEEKLRKHLREHTDGATEEWIDTGVSYMKDETCPFCCSNTEENDTIRAFREYFSDEYSGHKQDIEKAIREVDTYLPSGGWREIKPSLASNESLLNDWTEDIDFGEVPSYDLGVEVEGIWKRVRSSITESLKRKKESPLEAIQLSESSTEAIDQFRQLQRKIASYNKQVKAWNNSVDAFKDELEGGGLEQAKRELIRLQNSKSRHQAEVSELCESLLQFQKEKRKLKEEKVKKRKELDAAEEELMGKYHDQINSFLDDASADFSIVELEKSMSGGNPSASYAIEISGEIIELGSARAEIGEKGFRNILSEGDRNTLAFAFFYAKVITDLSIADKTVVIDDPVSSLDSARRTTTINAIRKISEISKQVIVLSHSTRFLVDLGNNLNITNKDVDSAIMCIRKSFSPSSSNIEAISPGDLKDQIDDRYMKAIKKVKTFFHGGDASDLDGVESSLRIVLEDTLYRRYPERNLGMSSTSAWVGAIEDANPDSPLYDLKNSTYHKTLKDLNSFIHDSHHADNIPGAPNQDVSQLRVFAKKTLDFVYGTL